MNTLKIILDWQSWFELERFQDTLIVPLSIGVALLIVELLKIQKVEYLINILFDEKDPIIGFKELSGLKIFAILNMVLGFGLVLIGSVIVYRFKEEISVDTIYLTFICGVLLPSLGWSYAFHYLEVAWDKKNSVIQKISSLFLFIALIETLVFLYIGNIKQCSLFYLTIPSFVLLLKSKTEKEISKKQRVFWISSLTFNLVLVGSFFAQGLQAINSKFDETSLWINMLLLLAPTLAAYVSLIKYQKNKKSSLGSSQKTSKTVRVIAFVVLIALVLIASVGIKKLLINIKDQKSEHNAKIEALIGK